MAGLFDDIETSVEDIEVGLPRIKPGAYEFQITDITFKEFADDHATMAGQAAVIIEYTVIDGDESSELGKTYDSFCRIPSQSAQGDKAPMFASILKQNLMQIGIPESQLKRWDPENPDDLEAVIGGIGTGRIVKNKKNATYDNLYDFTLTEESGASDTKLVPSSTSLDADAWKQ